MRDIIEYSVVVYCLLNIFCIQKILTICGEIIDDFKLAIKDFTVLDIICIVVFLPLITVLLILVMIIYFIDNMHKLKIFKLLYKKPFKYIDKK